MLQEKLEIQELQLNLDFFFLIFSQEYITEVSHNVQTEPSLQPITTETFSLASANTADDARLDIKTRGFWSRGQDAYFDVRVFYPNASSYRSLSLHSAYKRHEDAKNREYGHRIRDIEHGVFTPLVLPRLAA